MTIIKLSELKKIVSKLSGVSEDKITEETTLIEDLHLDSLKFVELIAILGEEHNLIIREEDAVNLQSVGQIYKLANQS